jgi:hypothetical protein
MTAESRPLTAYESLFMWASIGPIVCSATLHGRIDTAVLDEAVRLLRRDYPLLGCAVRRTGNEYALVAGADDSGLILRAPTGDDLAAEVNNPLPLERTVSRITLSQTDQTAVLSLAIEHVVADGRLLALMFHRLLDYYAQLMRGEVPRPTGRSAFEGTLQDALLAGYTPALPYIPADTDAPLTLSGRVAPGAAATGGLGVRNLGFGRATTASILAAARRHRISITSLLAGAFACAVRAQFLADDAPLPVAPAFAVDLRPRLVPGVAADAPFCCASHVVTCTPVAVGEHPAEVGRRVGAELRAALERDEPQRMLLAQRLARPAVSRPRSFMLSNIGIIEDFPESEGLRVGGVRFAGTARGSVPLLLASTLRGRLNLDVVYDADAAGSEQVEEVIGQFELMLTAGAGARRALVDTRA